MSYVSGSRSPGLTPQAFITAMNQNPTQSYVELLKAIRAILKDKYTQTVQLSSSHRECSGIRKGCEADRAAINTDLEFIA